MENHNNLWKEIIKSMLSKLENLMEKWTNDKKYLIQKFMSQNENLKFLQNEELFNLNQLTSIISYYNFPINSFNEDDYYNNDCNINYLDLILKMKKFNLENYAIRCLWKVLNNK